MHSFSFTIGNLTSAHYVLYPQLGAEDAAVSKTDKTPVLLQHLHCRKMHTRRKYYIQFLQLSHSMIPLLTPSFAQPSHVEFCTG